MLKAPLCYHSVLELEKYEFRSLNFAFFIFLETTSLRFSCCPAVKAHLVQRLHGVYW